MGWSRSEVHKKTKTKSGWIKGTVVWQPHRNSLFLVLLTLSPGMLFFSSVPSERSLFICASCEWVVYAWLKRNTLSSFGVYHYSILMFELRWRQDKKKISHTPLLQDKIEADNETNKRKSGREWEMEGQRSRRKKWPSKWPPCPFPFFSFFVK